MTLFRDKYESPIQGRSYSNVQRCDVQLRFGLLADESSRRFFCEVGDFCPATFSLTTDWRWRFGIFTNISESGPGIARKRQNAYPSTGFTLLYVT